MCIKTEILPPIAEQCNVATFAFKLRMEFCCEASATHTVSSKELHFDSEGAVWKKYTFSPINQRSTFMPPSREITCMEDRLNVGDFVLMSYGR